MMDRYVGELDALGCVLVLTADHGMNDKHLPNGEPDVIYLQTSLDEWLGKGKARVILPITDPYVVHHGALGSFATVYLPADADAARAARPHWPRRGRRCRARRGGGLRALRAAGRSHRRHRGDLDHAQGARHRARAARSFGPHRAAALAWRAHRAGGADDRQSRVDVRAGSTLRNFDIFDVALNRVAA